MDRFPGNFRRLDQIDVSAVKAKIRALTHDDWEAYNWCQNRPTSAQAETQSIPLIFDEDFRHVDPTVYETYYELDCDTLVEPVVRSASDYYTGDGYIVSSLLVRLKGRWFSTSITDIRCCTAGAYPYSRLKESRSR